jgi:hypothetical protein
MLALGGCDHRWGWPPRFSISGRKHWLVMHHRRGHRHAACAEHDIVESAAGRLREPMVRWNAGMRLLSRRMMCRARRVPERVAASNVTKETEATVNAYHDLSFRSITRWRGRDCSEKAVASPSSPHNTRLATSVPSCIGARPTPFATPRLHAMSAVRVTRKKPSAESQWVIDMEDVWKQFTLSAKGAGIHASKLASHPLTPDGLSYLNTHRSLVSQMVHDPAAQPRTARGDKPW